MLQDLLQLFYPELCPACDTNPAPRGETFCTTCAYKLTPTNYHTLEKNPVIERFWGRVEVRRAASLMVFAKEGLLQQLIHKLKYENRPDIGHVLGRWYGGILKTEGFLRDVEAVIPVPMHPKKEFERGYNQAACFAQGIAEAMGLPWSKDWLVKVEQTTSQTKKSRTERFDNVKDSFRVADVEAIRGRNLLLVDDVLTTGATLEACALQLLAVPDVRVNVATIAITANL